MESHLALKKIEVSVNNKKILDVDDLSFSRGEIVGLMGENGAGKSTLIRSLALLERPSKGEIFINGKRADSNLVQNRKSIALVFQDTMLFTGTVLSNVSYPLRLRNLSKSEVNQRSKSILSSFGIEDLALRNAKTLSGGEAKRVCIARALVYDPQILLLDEPFSDLDKKIRQKLEKELFGYLRKKSTTTVFVSHNFEEIAKCCSGLVVMRSGRIVQHDSISTILKKPKNKYIADIIGDTNFVEAKIEKGDKGGLTVRIGKNKFVVADSDRFQDGKKVLLNLRPEDIFISNNGAFRKSSVRNSFNTKIEDIISTGALCRIRLQGDFQCEAVVTKQSVEELELFEGKSIVAGFKATAAKLLDKEND